MLDSLLIAQREDITAWFTPVWMLSVGMAVGIVLVLVFLALLYGLAKIPALNSLADNQKSRLVVGSTLTVIIAAILIPLSLSSDFDQTAGYQSILGDVIAAEDAERQSDRNSLRQLLVILSVLGAPIVGFGSISLVSHKRATELLRSPWEGFLYWLSLISIGLSVFALTGIALFFLSGLNFSIVDEPIQRLKSLARLPYTGTFQKTYTIPETDNSSDGHIIPISFVGSELRWIEFKTDQRLELATRPLSNDLPTEVIFRNVTSDSGRFVIRLEEQSANTRIPLKPVDKLYAYNFGDSETDLTIRWRTEAEYPQVAVIPKIAFSVFGIYLFLIIGVVTFPKISAIAMSTFKTEVSQPIFIILLVVGGIFMVASVYIPYNTFGEDIKMYQDSGLTLIRVLAIFLAIWAASKSVAEEIDGRTALTVLSKPVGRRQFIFGKYIGISLAVGLLFVVLGLWFVFWTSYKPIYDSVETAERTYSWLICFQEAFRVVPGLILGYMESVVFVAISVAISTRVGILPNFLICFAIYVMGHLTPLIVQSAEAVGSFEGVVVFGQIVATVVPVLDHFDVQAAINSDSRIPFQYIGWAGVYSLLYSSIAMLLALVLFEDRDLA